ncbi:RiPP maturation radical SAM C-methyltransferase [Virgisporangium aurantiacum]|uniref:RiPP maturation radical SAM protein 1 n=1 Tax=Virgisporangium aurantiacum TaxID=175570 RepID=A0A8J3ZEL1_9ACTN|nr:RiPP maturation radical SAM C-methyltransferase [Virgisporangium aurantiacum]GIJ60186.1 RiPP maturation radical SAM protein 1 [Virgisporangium aurantiacum]
MRTVLVSMPFMDIDRPSIQLGLLTAIGAEHGFAVRTLHANLDLAARVGVDDYVRLAGHRSRLVGEWLFSVEAFGASAPDPSGTLLESPELPLPPERLRHIRDHEVPAFLDALLLAEPWHEVDVVGFSSTYQQNAASFALARRLKQRYPGIVTLFGGANFDGEMGPELVRSVDCVDLAVVGEADTAFPAVLRALADGTDPAAVPGVVCRAGGAVSATPPAPPHDRLDELPAPDYTEYFDRLAALDLPRDTGWIPFESARGCWWGAKHHCTFCGLNGSTMAFRSKSPDRVRTELALLARRHRSFRFAAVDNILDPTYLTTLVPALADDGYQLFYEVKANLTRAQVRLLARAGVTHLQPGLESLSTNVLRLMRKGVRAAQNVNLLRWARYYGVDVAWSILCGFPGECETDYAGQALAAPHLVHLQPPASVDRIWLERFSPLFTTIPRRTPEASYRLVYPSTVDLDRMAYFFDYDLPDALPDSAYESLRDAVSAWNTAWHTATLTYRSTPGFVQIFDNRSPDGRGTYTFEGPLADLYLACVDRPTTASAVRAKLGLTWPVEAVEEAFGEFGRRGLMFLDGNLAVALALPAVPGR